MTDNRISANLIDADKAAVLDAIQTIRTKLPFLIDLTPEERKGLPRLGDKSQAFVGQALELATQNEDILPRSFDVDEFRKDVELFHALRPIVTAFTQLQELLDDTYVEVGSEAYSGGLAVYQYARAAGKGAALDNLLEGLAQRFARKSGGKDAPSTPKT